MPGARRGNRVVDMPSFPYGSVLVYSPPRGPRSGLDIPYGQVHFLHDALNDQVSDGEFIGRLVKVPDDHRLP